MRHTVLISALFVLSCLCSAREKVTLFIAGDSTAQTYDPDKTPMRGWAQQLQQFFDENLLLVSNHSIGGRSTGTFIAEGRWQRIADSLKPGDWVFIQFGHNDTSPNPQRYVAPQQYKANLENMCREAIAKGAHPCILTSIVMRTFRDGILVDERNHFAEYIQIARDAAAELDVPLIDMSRLTTGLVRSLGDEASAELYYHVKVGDHPMIKADKNDDTHLREKGATAYARLAVEEIVRQNLPIASCVLPPRLERKEPHFAVEVNTEKEPVAQGPYDSTVASLSDYQCPEWFRDAKFGIWAHWGPQCAAEDGDWYARNMYDQGSRNYKYQIDAMGHPSEYGFKDWIPEFTAENWNPDSLIHLYKDAGAKYFMTLANHHDNFDLYDSDYQSWNSTVMGPRRDIVGEWAAACRKYGLALGVSVHASHAWSWYETSRGNDSTGPLKGVPYDGWLTAEDGKGKWWEGYDPQELYAQNHPLSVNSRAWDWEEDQVVTPDQEYCDKFYNRTVQLINDYNPDVVYFDDTYLPLWPVSDAGLKITAHLYNRSIAANDGENRAVITGKVLNEWQKETIVWDVERGAPDKMQEKPWQTCTCIGSWHYDKHVYYNDGYKSPAKVITMLVDVVSKNGNLLLSVPLNRKGEIDPTEYRIVKSIGHWMDINGESIYGTRPWLVFGEGPSAESENSLNAQGFNEGRLNYGAADIRFNKKGDKTLYVTLLGVPEGDTVIRSLGFRTNLNRKKIKSVTLLGSTEDIAWVQTAETLTISKPENVPSPEAIVYKVIFK